MDRIAVLEERLADVPLFAGLSGGHRRVIAELAHRVEVPAGTTLTVQGDEGRDFMIVLEGDVEVRAGDAVVTTLGPGSYFGEIALLDDRPRTATLTALTPMVVEVIGRSGFALALAEVPGLSDELRDAMDRRLHELDGDTAG
jgi:CRP-like cAMP-binding protein